MSIDISSTSHEALLGVCLILFMTLCLLTLTDKSRIQIIIIVLIFSGLFQSIYGTLMTLTGTEYSVFMKKESYLGVATGTFINRNHLAGYLVLCLCAGIGLMISKLGSGLRSTIKYHTREIIRSVLGSKILIRLALVMLVAGLVMTHSRMGNSAFFISLSIASIITLLFHQRSTKSMVLFFITILVIDFFVVGSFFGVSKIAERLQNTTSANESRDEVNSHSLAMIDNLDYSGSGAGSFYTLFPGYRTYDSGDGFYLHTHNDYLQFIIEYGLLPSIALFTGVVLVFIYALLALRKRRSSLHIGIAFSSIMAIIAFAIHSTVDFNLQIPANAATFMLLLSLGLISYHQPSTAIKRSRKFVR
ncbi:O-antigen ligase family protein [Amphritea sp. HPY]|uniref:O-antigen ligase family protein n=1 Tax=Amphritea sp. HPY TaxID=3421652 RepID=UPI003D7F0DB9